MENKESTEEFLKRVEKSVDMYAEKPKALEEMNADELTTVQVKKENEYQSQSDLQTKWTIEKLRIEKEIALLRIKHNEAKSVLTMCDGNMKRTNSELRVIKTLLFAALRGQ